MIGGVCRFTLHGTIHGRQWAQILDMHIDSASGGDRDDHVKDQAQVLLNAWIDNIKTQVSNQCILTSVSWVDLDSASGSTGSRSDATAPRVMPAPGLAAGNPLAGHSAVLIKKQAIGGRGARSGRWYLPGMDESDFTANTMVGSVKAALQAKVGTFLSAINQSGKIPVLGGGTYDSELVVVHTPQSGPASTSKVTAFTVDSTMATQRRRLRS